MISQQSTYNLSFIKCICLLAILPAFILLASCKKSFTSNQFVDDKLVLLAEITAGDSMEIPIGKTIRVGSGGLIRFEKVTDATAKINDASANSFMLLPNYSMQYAANPTTVFTNRRRFRANTNYYIEIKHPTLGIVRASTHVPPNPKLISIDTAAAQYQGRAVLAANITFQDDPLANNFYIIEAVKELVKISHFFFYRGVRYSYDVAEGKTLYNQVKNTAGVRLLRDTVPQNKFTRINLYTEDANTENSRINSLTNPFRRIFMPDHTFNGQHFTIKVFLDRQFFAATEAQQKGRVLLQLKCASKELYDYLLVYEKYKTDFGSVPTSQLISPVGNVDNGLGIFGGSSKREHIYYFDTF